MSKEPIKPKIPVDRETEKPFPYVLFLHDAYVQDAGDTTHKRRPEYFYLDVTGSHGHPEKLNYYLSKGFKIVEHYIPEFKKKADGFKGYTDFGDEKDHYRDMRSIISRVINTASPEKYKASEEKAKSLEDENKLLQAKLEKALADKADKNKGDK